MATTKKKSNFGQNVRSAYNSAKKKTTDYSAAIREAYQVGYQAGWEARENVPESFGARSVAVTGFRNGLRAHTKHNKTKQRYQSYQSRGGKK